VKNKEATANVRKVSKVAKVNLKVAAQNQAAVDVTIITAEIYNE
jgi:hypothetical protein